MIQHKVKKDLIVAYMKEAGYFSFSIDFTFDILHTDQLTFISCRGAELTIKSMAPAPAPAF